MKKIIVNKFGYGFYARIMVSIMLALSSIILMPIQPSAAAEESLEYSIKAAFLFKFGSFVEWPAQAFPNPQSPIIIGVYGEDPFGSRLDRIVQGKTISNRPVVLKRYQRIEQAREAHILFISETENSEMENILETLKGSYVLTVSERNSSMQNSGMINFIIVDNNVRFEINLASAEREGLKVSSKLLNLAKTVKTRSNG